jgi:hypothetical protein
MCAPCESKLTLSPVSLFIDPMIFMPSSGVFLSPLIFSSKYGFTISAKFQLNDYMEDFMMHF